MSTPKRKKDTLQEQSAALQKGWGALQRAAFDNDTIGSIFQELHNAGVELRIMGQSGGSDYEYGKIFTEFGDIPDDEPVVLFRGTDIHLPGVLKAYAGFCTFAPHRQRALVTAKLLNVITWQDANRDKLVQPDGELSRLWIGDSIKPAGKRD